MVLVKEKLFGFGVKLINIFGIINNKGVLFGEEMYMLGCVLFLFFINVVVVFFCVFDGKLFIFYFGGVSQLIICDIFDIGICFIIMVIDLLKFGGYLCLSVCMCELEGFDVWGFDYVDVE